jgi:hypothetical protein
MIARNIAVGMAMRYVRDGYRREKCPDAIVPAELKSDDNCRCKAETRHQRENETTKSAAITFPAVVEGDQRLSANLARGGFQNKERCLCFNHGSVGSGNELAFDV